MNRPSLLISLSSLTAQRKSTELKTHPTENENYLFFGTIAQLPPDQLLKGLSNKYALTSTNAPLEYDHATDLIIISQIAARKFARFNTPFSLIIVGPVRLIGYATTLGTPQTGNSKKENFVNRRFTMN